MLAHLAAVLGQDVAQAQHVLVGGLVEDQGADGHQGVEPAAGLVDGLADEVGRVGALEGLDGPFGVRVPPLGEGHRAGVEPGIDHLGHPAEGALNPGQGEGDVVDVGAVRVERELVLTGHVGQLGQGSDADQVAGVGVVAPDRQRGAPVARPRQRPVDVVVQPVTETAVLDVVGEPGGGLILAQQFVLDLGGADVPGRLGVVQQCGVATPAVRVGVLVVEQLVQQPPLAQVGDQGGVGGLEELPPDQRHRFLEGAIGAHRVDHRQPVASAHRHVVGTERRRLVHQTGAVLGGDVVGQHDEV